MKNIMSRDEYLQGMDEGFVKDTVKKGWQKVKEFFKIGMQKIKNFIAVFDNKGTLLPVVTPQAVIDKFSGSDAVKIYASSSLNDSVADVGGNPSKDKLSLDDSEETYDLGPKGDEYSDWIGNKGYEDTIEYKNFMTMVSTVKERYEALSDEEKQKLNESWEQISKARAKYHDKVDLKGLHAIGVEKFEKVLNGLIEDWVVMEGTDDPLGNILVFGAPGIGKSTVPNAVIKKYNEKVGNDPSKMASIISINCANLDEGDFMMPTMPKEINILDELGSFKDAFPEAASSLDEMDPDQKKKIALTIYQSGQFKATDAPKSWLPSFRETGDDYIDGLLNDYSNGGVYKYTDENGRTRRKKTGSGGIIIFDEFLRCKPGVFGQLMNFLLDRSLNGWLLGSKWVIIACSNRPCDDNEVEERWGDWSPAARDRWARIYQLVPEPEQWKEWARSKGCDELLLEFIFEKDSQTAEHEYPRWHSMVKNGAGDTLQNKEVTPRNWERVFVQLKKAERRAGVKDMSELDSDDLDDVLYGAFTDDFVAIIKEWLRTNMDSVNLDAIMEDPQSYYLPEKFKGDAAKALILVKNLTKKFIDKFKDDPKQLTDDMLANVFIWLGINYRGDVVAVQKFINDLAKKIFPEGDQKSKVGFRFADQIKTNMILYAAYPSEDMKDEIEECEKPKLPDGSENTAQWPKGSYDQVIKYMRKYFPWRISGDKIHYYEALDVDFDVNDEDTVDVHTIGDEGEES